ncbi:MAG: T9SS type B sorting domain-containing protein, partial [Flavobacteriales bacterium]|nr:T9SS type B sorting domain-containing protein [Flavobacteriales bacterium]
AYDYEFTWFEQSIGFTSQGMGAGFDDLTDLCASEDTVGYEIIIVDDNECIQNEFFVMEEPEELTFEFDVTDVSCSGFTDGAVTVTVSGGVPPYMITWQDSTGTVISMTDSIVDVGEGWYYVSVIDLNGCTGNDSVEVTTPNPLIVPIDFVPYNGFGVTCVNDCNGTIFAPVTGGTEPYNYDWSDQACAGPYISDEPAVLGGLCAGTYFLNVTDDQGCMTCESISLIEPDSILADDAVVMDISCEGEMDGSIDLMLTGGVPTYDVDWVPNVGTGETVSGLGVGSYTALVQDQNDCTAQFEFDIEEPEELIAVASSPLVGGGFNISCNSACDGSLFLDISGGVGTYSVSWTGSAPVGGSTATSFVGVVCAGTYTATITDDNGCTIEETITLTEPPSIVFTFIVEQPISCNGECDGQLRTQVNGGVPPYEIVWNDPNMTEGPITGDDLCAGTYCATVTDANGCVASSCFPLNEPDVFVIDCIVSDVTCTGADDGAIDCTLSGGTLPYACTWTGPDGFTSTDEDLTNLAPGEYCVTCIDARGCEVEACYTIGEPDPLVLTVTTSDYNGFEVSCPGACDGEITLSAVGGTPGYTFLPAVIQTELCVGIYTVSVEDLLGCVVSIDVELEEPDPIDITLTSPLFDCGTNINCPGNNSGAIFSTVDGGVQGTFTYNWIDVNATDTFDIGTNEAVDQLLAGDYELYVVDANGCSGTETITLTQPTDTFTVDVMPSIVPSGDNISCADACDGTISFTPLNVCVDATYSWFFEAEPISDLDDLCAGTYTLIAIDSAECTFTDTLTLSEPLPLMVEDSVTQSLCAGDNAGAVDLTVSGGSPDYTFDWDDENLDDVEDQEQLDPGDYSVTVTDFNGCEFILDFTLTEPDSLSVDLISPILLPPDYNISSYLGSDGVIDAIVEGGTAPFTFVWTGDDGFTSDQEDLSGLTAQSYCLEVTDANGCVTGECIELTEPDDLELPNGMSPNGDGLNDGLIIQGIEAFPDNTVKVFNRWGDEVFVANGYSNGNRWNGESDSGGIVPDGTYFVILVVKDGEGERELNAYLEIRR